MNAQIAEAQGLVAMTVKLRDEMLDSLTDGDLGFRFDGNPSLGSLIGDLARTEASYVASFRSFSQEFESDEADAETSVEEVKKRFADLDGELRQALDALSDDDVANKQIARNGFSMPILNQIWTYREAVLIVCAKATPYLKALNKTFSEQWKAWL